MDGKISFKKLMLEDLPFLLEIRNDISTRKFLEVSSTFSLEECKSWFIKANPDWYIIIYNDTPVGYFRTSIVDDEYYIGADIHPYFRGKKIGYDSYKEFFKYKKFKFNYIYLKVFKDNIIAYNLYKKLGFELVSEELIYDRIYLKMKLKL